MASCRTSRHCLVVEPLEQRLSLSGTTQASAIGTATGSVAQPHEVSQTTVTVAPANITPQKQGTLFGVFVEPASELSAGAPDRFGAGEQRQGLALAGRAARSALERPVKPSCSSRTARPGRSPST